MNLLGFLSEEGQRAHNAGAVDSSERGGDDCVDGELVIEEHGEPRRHAHAEEDALCADGIQFAVRVVSAAAAPAWRRSGARF